MSYSEFPEYVSVAEKKEKALRALERLKKKDPDVEPVIIEGRTLTKSWWGKAWNQNLEKYADYSNRIGRGKSYVRNNALLDLRITKGNVVAKVQGTRKKPYDVQVTIDTLNMEKWQKVLKLCNRKIDTLEQLIEGKFPVELESLFKDKKYLMFPTPKEIQFYCSCPDYAYMCKHVAAVLYGIGARFDKDPMLFFELRGVDGRDLVRKSIDQKIESMLKNVGKKSRRQIQTDKIKDIFGI